jgi:hypothetical protein
MDRQYNDQKKHGQAIQRPKETWTDNTTIKVLSVHVSVGLCIACPCFFWSLYCRSMFLTWTDNTTTKRNMDRQYNYQKKHGQAIQLPKETWTDNTTISFARCIVCPCFLWSLYCLSMFLLVVVLSVHVYFGRCIVCPCFFWSTTKRNMDRQYNDQKKHGQAIQRQKETWTDNTTTKRNMDRQYNDQKKHGQTIQQPNFFW